MGGRGNRSPYRARGEDLICWSCGLQRNWNSRVSVQLKCPWLHRAGSHYIPRHDDDCPARAASLVAGKSVAGPCMRVMHANPGNVCHGAHPATTDRRNVRERPRLPGVPRFRSPLYCRRAILRARTLDVTGFAISRLGRVALGDRHDNTRSPNDPHRTVQRQRSGATAGCPCAGTGPASRTEGAATGSRNARAVLDLLLMGQRDRVFDAARRTGDPVASRRWRREAGGKDPCSW